MTHLGRWAAVAAMGLGLGCDEAALSTVRPILKVSTDTIDFGAIPERTTAVRVLQLQNPSAVALSVEVSLEAGGSSDFSLAGSSFQVAPQSMLPLEVTFTPVGPGEDEGTVVVTSPDLSEARFVVPLRGGPIAPCLSLSPDPLDFAPATSTVTARPVAISNVCDADLHLESIAIDPGANPDFSLRALSVPVVLGPGESVEAVVEYTRGARGTAGRLVTRASDADVPEHVLRLLPDPLRSCENGLDDDGDGLVDFPEDPGCTSRTDDDESNPPECDDGTTMPCGSDVGECARGTRTCANRIWGDCEGGVAATLEVCNGLDDDCDGRSDEEVTEACTINGCSGARLCVENSGTPGGQFSECLPVGATSETCNGIDDDCDGQTDEGIVRACVENGCSGMQICVPGGTGEWTTCQLMPQMEICDTMDNDCNGTPDDNIPNIFCGTGECRRTALGCVNGAPETCVPGTPVPEVCNGLDDDCSGAADDNLANIQCGVGECRRSVAACAGGAPNTCVPGAPGPEICNGLDDDCNGTPDDLGNVSCGVGQCRRTVAACMGGAPTVCVPGMPTMEVCNGLDDNCNGTPDDLPNLTCGLGICARTVPACSGGAPNTCVPGVAGVEICNGLDDDCNGTPDDNGACGGSCGLMSTAPDPQEPNNSAGGANPTVPAAVGTRVFDYDLTLPVGDEDWIQFLFPPPGSASFASMSAQITCVSWAGAGCGAAPTVGLAAWYFDDVCTPGGQQDGFHNGQSGLAFVTSSGSVSPFGICVPQRFRVRAFASSAVCAGEALNAHVRVTVTFN